MSEDAFYVFVTCRDRQASVARLGEHALLLRRRKSCPSFCAYSQRVLPDKLCEPNLPGFQTAFTELLVSMCFLHLPKGFLTPLRACVALADEEALREGKLRALREAVKLHQQRLGLRFQHHDGRCCAAVHIVPLRAHMTYGHTMTKSCIAACHAVLDIMH